MFVLLTAENTYYTANKKTPFSKNISDAIVFDSLENAKKEQQIMSRKYHKTTSINTFIG
ncbi:hypothetical protein SAMN04489761_3397 [Tenacibaculum sp. MAR_2009_124]|uniref:hypothetical protein n=1 Tax=Tenacibaculum sp. MAR_2009_124 TaxID=1250059 RepID=UPI00089A4E0C|nr:hypothetical protein [Tenacibaculum sp. MAR_2009_124]SEC65008.1 hypothetical protein SAMN04489761_3397 [Tenacibaculum sp. MAR_2009_124]